MENNILSTTTSQLDGNIKDFDVNSRILDSPSTEGETYHNNENFTINHGYYRTIPELKKAIDALGIWVIGKGWKAEPLTQTLLENVKGNGKQNFQQIMMSHLIMKKINGDAYTEIIWVGEGNKKKLGNLKLLNPLRIRVVYDDKGMIKRYDYLQNDNGWKPIDKENIFHSMNDPIGDEIHGVSVIEACKWVIDAKNEAMKDWRRISHRSTIRILYVDIDDTDKIAHIREQYKEGIRLGEVLVLPVKKGESAQFEDLQLPPIEAFMRWIEYLDDFFYQAVGVPKIITGRTQAFTEASSKVGYLTFDPVYSRDQLELEADFWNQVGLKFDCIRPAELGGVLSESENKNTGQLGFQPSEFQVGRNE